MSAGTRAKPGSDLEHLVMRRVGHAIGDYRLIEAGDRILVAVSGGEKSFVLLHILDLHRRRFPHSFELIPVFVDVFGDPQRARTVESRYAAHGFDVRIISCDIIERIEQGGAGRLSSEDPCTTCCRLRKSVLAGEAETLGCNKIASGETLDDFVEHLFYNMFFHGRLGAIGVHLPTSAGRPEEIRPQVNVERELAIELAGRLGFEPAEADCAFGRTANPRRETIENMIAEITAAHPRAKRSLLAAMKHLRPGYLLDIPDVPDPASIS
jgi:tRNA 2-thiocytidine biosynthesis protein TtcA